MSNAEEMNLIKIAGVKKKIIRLGMKKGGREICARQLHPP